MKIILIAAVSNLGRIGDIVEVKNGYAKNFLIPNKKAICFTPSNFKVFEAKKQEFEKENQKNIELAGTVKDKIGSKDVIIIQNASDDGRLYGSVSSAVIAGKINEMIGQKSVSRADIFLKKPIKEIGVYETKIGIHSDLSFDVRLIVTRSESEIEALLKADKKNNKSSSQDEVIEAANNDSKEVVEEKKPAKTKAPKKKKTETVAE